MSAEMLTTLLTGLGLLLSFVGAFGWLVHRMDAIAERLDGRITDTRTELKGDLSELRTEFKRDLSELRTELKEDTAALRTELKEDISELRTELKEDIAGVREGVALANHELGEMRISVARLEGPLHPGLIRPT